MSKTRGPTPTEVVPQWPLVLCLCLFAVGACLSMRLGRTQVALVLVATGVGIPVVGHFLRFCLGLDRPRPPRVRRVVVAEDSTRATIPLETAKYLTPPESPVSAPQTNPSRGSEFVGGLR